MSSKQQDLRPWAQVTHLPATEEQPSLEENKPLSAGRSQELFFLQNGPQTGWQDGSDDSFQGLLGFPSSGGPP